MASEEHLKKHQPRPCLLCGKTTRATKGVCGSCLMELAELKLKLDLIKMLGDDLIC